MCKLTFAWFTRDVTAIIWAVCAKMFFSTENLTRFSFKFCKKKKNCIVLITNMRPLSRGFEVKYEERNRLIDLFSLYVWFFQFKGLFTWSGGPRSSGVGFFCFHALRDTKQKKPTPLDRGPPLLVNRVLDHVMFSTEFTFCMHVLCTWMHEHRTFERNKSLGYNHVV